MTSPFLHFHDPQATNIGVDRIHVGHEWDLPTGSSQSKERDCLLPNLLIAEGHKVAGPPYRSWWNALLGARWREGSLDRMYFLN